MAFISGEKCQILSKEHKKSNFDFGVSWEQANLFQGNKGTGTPREGPRYNSITIVYCDMTINTVCPFSETSIKLVNLTLLLFIQNSVNLFIRNFTHLLNDRRSKEIAILDKRLIYKGK